ncbi:E3 ubiquitin-protein ligase RHA2B, partial [Linum perenne]
PSSPVLFGRLPILPPSAPPLSSGELSEGKLFRELHCRHVFHKGCLDGWLRHCNFTCPICRSPLLIDAEARGRVVV